MMEALTRNQATAQIRDILLDGHSLTPTQFDRYLSAAGGHERSRVLTLFVMIGVSPSNSEWMVHITFQKGIW